MRDMKRDVGQVGNRNRLIAIVAAAITFFSILIWGVPGIDPSLWDEVSVVAGVRPPHSIFPGFWRVLVGGLFSLIGTKAATAILPFLGAVIAAVCSYLVCLITRQVLALLIRTAKPYPVWYKRIAPFFSFVAAVLFGISDPLLRVAQVFSPDELRLVIFLVHPPGASLVRGRGTLASLPADGADGAPCRGNAVRLHPAARLHRVLRRRLVLHH